MTNLSDELKRLSAAATPGPWLRHNNPKKWVSTLAPVTTEQWNENADNDAALIIALRNNLPALIAALRAQQHADALADGMDRAITFIEALADNDLDEPIADNGMTVGAKLQMDAPPLIFKLRAALAAYRSVK